MNNTPSSYREIRRMAIDTMRIWEEHVTTCPTCLSGHRDQCALFQMINKTSNLLVTHDLSMQVEALNNPKQLIRCDHCQKDRPDSECKPVGDYFMVSGGHREWFYLCDDCRNEESEVAK